MAGDRFAATTGLVISLALGALLAGCPRKESSVSPGAQPVPVDARPPDVIPPGSGSYGEVLALATRFKDGKMTFDDLKAALVARKLRPYPPPLGCAYLMTPAPVPPPGVPFDARMMPRDWEGTWGEVAMAFWLGRLTRSEYDALHAAAHPSCPGP